MTTSPCELHTGLRNIPFKSRHPKTESHLIKYYFVTTFKNRHPVTNLATFLPFSTIDLCFSMSLKLLVCYSGHDLNNKLLPSMSILEDAFKSNLGPDGTRQAKERVSDITDLTCALLKII